MAKVIKHNLRRGHLKSQLRGKSLHLEAVRNGVGCQCCGRWTWSCQNPLLSQLGPLYSDLLPFPRCRRDQLQHQPHWGVMFNKTTKPPVILCDFASAKSSFLYSLMSSASTWCTTMNITFNLSNVILKPKIVTNGNWEASSNFQTLRFSITKVPDISSHCPKADLQKDSRNKTIKPPNILCLCISWKQFSYLRTSRPPRDAQ